MRQGASVPSSLSVDQYGSPTSPSHAASSSRLVGAARAAWSCFARRRRSGSAASYLLWSGAAPRSIVRAGAAVARAATTAGLASASPAAAGAEGAAVPTVARRTTGGRVEPVSGEASAHGVDRAAIDEAVVAITAAASSAGAKRPRAAGGGGNFAVEGGAAVVLIVRGGGREMTETTEETEEIARDWGGGLGWG